jgi:nucleoside triphosphate diphosphatase
VSGSGGGDSQDAGVRSDDQEAAARTAAEVQTLDAITRRLRRECPWDREQDERSIVPHTVEEAYELADAAGRGDDAKLLDELGDVLFQVHFLSLLLEERGAGDMAAVAEHCREKLVRRHPHVFGETEAGSADEVLRNWDQIKREVEGRGEGEPFADVPENLPALLYARKLQRRAESAGAEEGDATEAARALRTAADELSGLLEQGETGGPAAAPAERGRVERALGELLFAAVDAARRLRVDPELALRARSHAFRQRVESDPT